MPKPETITMSMQELNRLKMIQAVVAGQIKASAWAARLDLTRRQINRLIQRYLDPGPSGRISRKRDKPSNFQLAPGVAESALAINRRLGQPGHRQLAPRLADLALQIICDRYSDFGATISLIDLDIKSWNST